MKVNNKPIFIEWLKRFKKTVKSKNFKSINPYLGYIATIETHLKIGIDEIYLSNSVSEIQLIEEKLKKKKSFKELERHYQANLLAGLHLYEAFIGLLSNTSI
jgi:hypothetical protein